MAFEKVKELMHKRIGGDEIVKYAAILFVVTVAASTLASFLLRLLATAVSGWLR